MRAGDVFRSRYFILAVRRSHKIDFGSGQPDYSDEDWAFEKY